ncbi:hypothetical protein ACWDRX_17560 [Streptomyces nigra]|uniref:hypothetical protein n=1 Tax=Streptomyces nigra TaxID=1827580 RepID=UPI0036336437
MSTNAVTLAVAFIALAGVIFTPVFTAKATQRNRREDRLRAACDRFQDDCDALQDKFEAEVQFIFSRYNNPGYGDSLGIEQQRMGSTGESWNAVHTALRAVSRTTRRISQEDRDLGAVAREVHQSLHEEVNILREAGQTLARDALHRRWLEARQCSDRLREKFDDGVLEI